MKKLLILSGLVFILILFFGCATQQKTEEKGATKSALKVPEYIPQVEPTTTQSEETEAELRAATAISRSLKVRVIQSNGFTYVADGSTTTTRETEARGYVKITCDEPKCFKTSKGNGRELRVLASISSTDRTTSLTSSMDSGFSRTLKIGDVMLKLNGAPQRWILAPFSPNKKTITSTNPFTCQYIELGGGGFTYAADGSTTVTRETSATAYVKCSASLTNSFLVGTKKGTEIRVLLLTSGHDDDLSPMDSGFSRDLREGDIMLKLENTPERWVLLDPNEEIR